MAENENTAKRNSIARKNPKIAKMIFFSVIVFPWYFYPSSHWGFGFGFPAIPRLRSGLKQTWKGLSRWSGTRFFSYTETRTENYHFQSQNLWDYEAGAQMGRQLPRWGYLQTIQKFNHYQGWAKLKNYKHFNFRVFTVLKNFCWAWICVFLTIVSMANFPGDNFVECCLDYDDVSTHWSNDLYDCDAITWENTYSEDQPVYFIVEIPYASAGCVGGRWENGIFPGNMDIIKYQQLYKTKWFEICTEKSKCKINCATTKFASSKNFSKSQKF